MKTVISPTSKTFSFSEALHIALYREVNIIVTTLNNCFMKTFIRKFGVFAITLLIANIFFITQSFGQQGSQTFSTTGTSTFTVPAGVTSVRVECWGGGAGGSNSNNLGGGGGAFAGNNAVAVTPGSIITVTVGAFGDANGASNIAGNSSFGSFVIAAGANAGIGGLASASTGSLVFSGGNGGVSSGNGGAGGGGSAGAGGAGGVGGNTSNNSAGVGGTAGFAGSGTAGAAGGAGGSSGSNNGSPGNAPGGGGGERYSSGGTSGVGANGRVIVTYCAKPSQPSIISGTTSGCTGISLNYSVTNVSGVVYNWTFPAGWTQTGGGTTNSVTVTVGSGSGNITVTPSNSCGAGTARTLSFTLSSPISSVIGKSDISCNGAHDGTITVSASGGTPPYKFSVDEGASWQNATNGNTSLFTGLGPNPITPYKIIVEDANLCRSR